MKSSLAVALGVVAATLGAVLACQDASTSSPPVAVAPAAAALALPVPRRSARPRPPEPTWIVDPIFPRRRLHITGERAHDVAGIAGRKPPQPRLAPMPENRIETPPEQRGGVNPCDRPDPGYGIFSRWQFRSGFGKLIMPRTNPVNDQGGFDFIAHFHGADLARMEFVRGDVPAVFLAVRGNSSGTYPAMTGRHALDFLIDDLEAAMHRESSTGEARAEHVALAAWSGGYAAIGSILQQSDNWERIDAIVLLDGLHTARENPLGLPRLPNFAKFARRAQAGAAFLFISYSSIPTDGHASTTESTRLLIQELGGHPVRVEGDGPAGMALKEAYSVGNFHARGYKGGGALDHCAHLLLYPEVAQALHRQWYPAEER